MKKSLFLLVLIVVLSLALTACGGKTDPAPATNDPAPATNDPAPAGGDVVSKDADGKYIISEDSQGFWSFASSSSGGTWYNMVGGAINLFNESIEGVNFSVEASGGSVENARRVATNEAEFGLAYASHIYETLNGIGSFEGAASDTIRVMANVYASPHYFVTLADSGITCLADLAGKTVALGEAGSGTSANSRVALETLGIEVNAVEMSFSDAARALQDGQIAALGQGGAPASGVVELAASRDILIIPFSDEELQQITELAPYFYADFLPANTYDGQTEDVPTFFFAVYMICHQDTPDDLVAACMAACMEPENLEYLNSVHRQWGTLCYDAEGVETIGATYHPGALAYWDSIAK